MVDIADIPEDQKVEFALDPLDVLQENMEFYQTKAVDIGNQIVATIKANPKHRGDQLVQMYKMMTRAREMSIKVATELAPYRKPRLQSVEVKSKVEHRFVVRAPEQIPNTGDWLKNIGVNKEPIVLNQENKSAAKKRMQDITEYSDEDLVNLALKQTEKEFNTDPVQDIMGEEFVSPDDRLD